MACLKRGTLSPEELGLNLAEAKEILQSVQRSMTEHQVGDYTAERINCPCCGQRRVQKGHHPILFRTLFGKLTLNSLRCTTAIASQRPARHSACWRNCCRSAPRRS